MADRDLDAQLTKYLTEAHSIERQALVQMRLAPRIAGDPAIAHAFARHCKETEEHERAIRERLGARGATPAVAKDLAGQLTGAGFALFARAQPDTPGKLVAHAFSYEHLELAAYELLSTVSQLAGDEATVDVARRIRAQEDAMGGRLSELFGPAVDASLRARGASDLGREVVRYLQDAHALEAQSIVLLGRGQRLAGPPALEGIYAEHQAQTRQHAVRVAERLAALNAAPSRLKDAALSFGALNWGLFFALQPDTPAKLAGFAYAYEHLEIAGYELLSRVAQRAGDSETVELAESILDEERSAAERIFAQLDVALSESLQALGVRT